MAENRKAYPLKDKKIVVTRPEDSVDEMIDLLLKEKAVPIVFPTIETVPVKLDKDSFEKIKNLGNYDIIIFTSVKGVKYFFEVVGDLGVSYPCGKITVAIGPKTADELKKLGFSNVIVPSEYVAEAVLEVVGDVSGKKVLIPRAKVARDVLPVELERRGANVDVLVVYETVVSRPKVSIDLIKDADVLTFTSPSTFKAFCEIVGEALNEIMEKLIIASIGPITSKAISSAGYTVHVEASEYTVNGLVKAIKDYFLAS